jgi:DNA-binding response OmpR family regulator
MTDPLVPRRPCVLLVDDTPANIDVLVGLLQGDYDLKVASRGARALKICEAAPHIDLILLDVMMPEMDGFEVCQTLRSNPTTRDIPVIFLTAKTGVDDVVRGFAVGSDDYVAKPFQPAELLARVRTHLRIRAQQREIDARNAELRELLHIVSHDVANQLGVVSMALELAARNPARPLETYLPHLEAAVRNGIGLTRAVRELRMSEDKPLPLQSVSLQGAVAEAVMLAEGRLQEKGLHVTWEVPDVQVIAERYSLTVSVLGNLLSNAVKFSQPGGTIAIGATLEPESVCLSVSDGGVGMPPQVLADLFDVARSVSRQGTAGEQGTGFGMPLMHRFVGRYGGAVEVVSRDIAAHPDDHGTEFRIHLRRATAG